MTQHITEQKDSEGIKLVNGGTAKHADSETTC